MVRCQPVNPERQITTPLDVFYVVETTGRINGKRHHTVCSSLFETRRQAETEQRRLQVGTERSTFSIWQGSTYVEPAEWLYDVVMADGRVIRSRCRKPRPCHAAFSRRLRSPGEIKETES